MSNDLIKRLRSPLDTVVKAIKERAEAADRIEQLEESNKELTLQLLATSGQAADALDRAVIKAAVELMGEEHGWVRRERLDEAVNIAALALTALHEVQTYKQPDDPDEENALTMHELDAFDFDVDRARTVLAELEGGK
jgi:hypothetical protein